MSQESVPPLPKSGSNFNGCLIGCLVVVVLGVLAAGIASYTFYRSIQGTVTAYTEDKPQELPVLKLDDAQMAAAKEKIEQFRAAVDSGTGPREFSFTGDELNVMLRNSEPGGLLGDSVYITIANSEVRGEVSLNLGALIPIFNGRYANGSATFNVYTEGGMLYVFIESFQVKGQAASQELLNGMRAQNLAQEAAKNPQFQAWISKVDEIRAEGAKLLVKLKGSDTAVPAVEPAPAEGAAPAEAPATVETPAPAESPAPAETTTPPSA